MLPKTTNTTHSGMRSPQRMNAPAAVAAGCDPPSGPSSAVAPPACRKTRAVGQAKRWLPSPADPGASYETMRHLLHAHCGLCNQLCCPAQSPFAAPTRPCDFGTGSATQARAPAWPSSKAPAARRRSSQVARTEHDELGFGEVAIGTDDNGQSVPTSGPRVSSVHWEWAGHWGGLDLDVVPLLHRA